MPNETTAPYTLRFLNACRSFGDRLALVDRTKTYSYSELKAIVFGIVNLLMERFPDETSIGVVDQNDVYTYASILAINLCGKTHVPFNIRYPEERLVVIAEKASVRIILSSYAFQCGNLQILLTLGITRGISEHFVPVKKSVNPAYLLFTSGSTGEPKGVPIYNHYLNAFFDYFLDGGVFHFDEKDRFLQVYETSFDVSVFSAFTPLLSGGCCYLLPRKSFAYLEIPQILSSGEITVLSIVPSMLHFLSPYFKQLRFEKLRYSFFSGDKLLNSLLQAWSTCVPQAVLVNCYGPTETTIVCSHYLWDAQKGEKDSFEGIVSIGKLFPGTSYVLRNENEIGPGLLEGELCLSGTQVIGAYLNNESPDKFIKWNLDGKECRYYCTGDRVRVNAEGNMLFLGRTDFQIKAGGYRVEPAEIETALRLASGSSFCVAMGIDSIQGSTQLIAFVEGKGDEAELIRQLRKKLPPHCIPSRITFLDHLPLNINGKVDRLELCKFV